MTRDIFKKFDSDARYLYSTSGFKNKDDLLKAIEESSPSAKRAAQILLDEKLEVVIAVPADTREQIVKEGFLNFREAKKSQGTVIGREVVEANYAGMSVEQYTALNPSFKPKYGYVGPTPESNLAAPQGIKNYGSDHFIFNLDKIRDRTTFTVGDSLNRHMNYTTGNDNLATTWDQRFIPWAHRELAAPAIAKGLEESKLGLSMPTFQMSLKELREELPSGAQNHIIPLSDAIDDTTKIEWASMETGIYPPAGSLEKYKIAWDASLDYIEVQIWDKLTLDDVRAFEFIENPPEGDFLRALQSRGIEIRDGRKR